MQNCMVEVIIDTSYIKTNVAKRTISNFTIPERPLAKNMWLTKNKEKWWKLKVIIIMIKNFLWTH